MVPVNDGIPACRESHTKSSDVIVYCKEDDTFPQSRRACHDVLSRDCNRKLQKKSCLSVSSIAKGNVGPRDSN